LKNFLTTPYKALYFLFIFQINSLFAQNNFVKLNLGGLLNPLYFQKEIRPEIPPTISFGFEKGFDSSNFSIGGQINYGNTFMNISTITPGYQYYYVIAYDGISFFTDLRKYFHFSKNKTSFNSNHEGFFIGLYSGIQNLNENQYLNYNPDDLTLTDFYINENAKIWILGLGAEVGLKKAINKRFYYEVMGGFGYGFVSKSRVSMLEDSDLKSRALNLIRLELSVGYKF
jgi:hypothetical protein